MAEPEDIVGVRFTPRGPLAWFKANGVPADPGSWVVAVHEGEEKAGQVIVGRGQCLEFPRDLPEPSPLSRSAADSEIPRVPAGRPS